MAGWGVGSGLYGGDGSGDGDGGDGGGGVGGGGDPGGLAEPPEAVAKVRRRRNENKRGDHILQGRHRRRQCVLQGGKRAGGGSRRSTFFDHCHRDWPEVSWEPAMLTWSPKIALSDAVASLNPWTWHGSRGNDLG